MTVAVYSTCTGSAGTTPQHKRTHRHNIPHITEGLGNNVARSGDRHNQRESGGERNLVRLPISGKREKFERKKGKENWRQPNQHTLGT